MADLHKIGLKIWESLTPKLPSKGGSISLTPLHPPRPPRKVYITLPSVNGPLPAELKFRDNTALTSHNLDFGSYLDHGLKFLSQR